MSVHGSDETCGGKSMRYGWASGFGLLRAAVVAFDAVQLAARHVAKRVERWAVRNPEGGGGGGGFHYP